MPHGIDVYARESATETIDNGEAKQFAWMLPRTPDKHSVNLIATASIVQRTAHIERTLDPESSLPACQKQDSRAIRVLENLRDLPWIAEDSPLFEGGCPTSPLALLPH